MKRNKMKVQSTPGMEEIESRREQRPRTFIPLNGFATDDSRDGGDRVAPGAATDGEPRALMHTIPGVPPFGSPSAVQFRSRRNCLAKRGEPGKGNSPVDCCPGERPSPDGSGRYPSGAGTAKRRGAAQKVPFTELRTQEWYMEVPFTELRTQEWYMEVPFTELRTQRT